jgi:hypothetical protein
LLPQVKIDERKTRGLQMGSGKSSFRMRGSMKHKILLSIAVVIAIGSLSWNGQAKAQDSIGNRLLAAEEYAETTDIKKMLDDAIAEMAKNVPSKDRETFIRNVTGSINAHKLRSLMVNAMVQVFTVEELNMLTGFYGSTIGKSIMEKFPIYMAAFMPTLQSEVKKAAGKK